ncbi:MAG: helix-turn-helix transcriptional regulator [Rhizobiales bacterium]|nr:helix-turn-helix transcriptional regulator [Hyphomicrobiales bacterium]
MKTLREWRAAKLHSSKTLATVAGVSNKTILAIENGHHLATFRTIARLTAALDLKPEDVAEFAAAIEERGKAAA